MTDKLKKLIEAKADELGWSIYCYDEGGWDFRKYSPAGEDFSFCVKGEDIAKEVSDYYADFNPDEHAKMWILAQGSVAGVPNVRTLVDDAYAILEMLQELNDSLVDVEQEYGEDDEDGD